METNNKKVKIRCRSGVLKEIVEKINKENLENPIVDRYVEDVTNPNTTEEHIKKLQEILVKTIIDYINHNNLTDIDAVYFNADGLQDSAKHGEWVAGTDSFIKIFGIQNEVSVRKDGKIEKWPIAYKIGEYC